MSLRQVRRLKELSGADKETPEPVHGDESGSDQDSPITAPRGKPSVFSRMRDSSSSSSSTSSESEGEKTPSPSIPAPTVVSKKSEQKPAPAPVQKVKKNTGTNKISAPGINSVVDPTVIIDIRFLNPSNELRRIFGRQMSQSSSGPGRPMFSKRRHWLIAPADRSWPLSVKDCFRMELCRDGSHRLVPESDYEAKLGILTRIVASHDLEALYQFIQFNPFHVHGLIQLAVILIEQRKEFENAYELIKRALYSIQSSFLPSFHPDKSLLLSKDSLFTSTVFRALLLYAHLLAGQGCLRTSLEVLKLVYLMEGGMATSCPMTHVLLHLDSAALRSEQYEFLSSFAASNALNDSLPGTSVLFAVSQKLRGMDIDQSEWNSISPNDIKRSCTGSTPATVALVRSILKFPGALKLVLGREIMPNRPAADILTNKLVQAFSIKGVACVKSKDEVMKWIEQVVSSELLDRFSNLNLKKPIPSWIQEGYSDITSSEFEWGATASFVEPAQIIEAEGHIMEMYLDSALSVPRPTVREPLLAHAVSLDSNPVAAFFQTLLPWSRVDTAGTESTPITATGLIERLFGAPPEPASEHSSDEEEIVME